MDKILYTALFKQVLAIRKKFHTWLYILSYVGFLYSIIYTIHFVVC